MAQSVIITWVIRILLTVVFGVAIGIVIGYFLSKYKEKKVILEAREKIEKQDKKFTYDGVDVGMDGKPTKSLNDIKKTSSIKQIKDKVGKKPVKKKEVKKAKAKSKKAKNK